MTKERENYIVNNWAEMWIENQILHVKYKENVISDLQCGKKILEDRLKISQGKYYPVFGDCRGVKYWTKENREFQSRKENYELMKACTVLYTESHVANILLNFYLRVNKPLVPTKFCSNEKEALEWLKQFIEK
ncbi:MAG TPA: hypothetical protein VIK89_01475 [Cytophagaceae bacterium]